METTIAPPVPKLKHKSFSYKTELTWEDKKRGVLTSHDKPIVVVSSPPEFKGEPGMWTPEDLLVAAVESCTMTTFMAFAQRLQLGIFSYDSHAEGILEFADGGYRFTKIILRPTVRVESADVVEQVRQTLRDAHKNCLISNSIRAEVILEPSIEVV